MISKIAKIDRFSSGSFKSPGILKVRFSGLCLGEKTFWTYVYAESIQGTQYLDKLLCLKNAGAQISMFFISNE